MTDLLGLPPLLLLLLPLAVAAGTDLYLTLLVLGLSAWLGDWAPGGDSLIPLGGQLSLLGLTLLYLIEAAAELRPLSALAWHNLQLLLRPLGGMLLGLILVNGASPGVSALVAVAAGLVAAFAHVLSWGGGLLLRISPQGRVSPATFNLALDTATLALVVLALERPAWGFVAAGLLLLTGLVAGGGLHGVTRFGASLLWGRIWEFSSPPGWIPSEDLPPWILREAGEDPSGGLRALRAGALGIPGVRGFRDGWVVERGRDLFFMFTATTRPRMVPLDSWTPEEESPGPLTLNLRFRTPGGGRSALFLQKNGPDLKPHK